MLQTHGGNCLHGFPRLFICQMENTELLRNVLAAIVSAGTIIFFLLRHLKRERVEQAHHIAQIIRITADNVFNGAKLETRVTALEKQERENSEYMRTSFNKVHERLDQIFTIIANKND